MMRKPPAEIMASCQEKVSQKHRPNSAPLSSSPGGMVLSLSDRCELAFRTRSHRCITSSSGSSSTKNWETSSTTNITQQQLSQPHKSSELSSNAPTISHDGTIAYSNGVLVSPKSSTIDEKLFSKAVAYVMKKVKDPEKVYDAFLDYFKKLYQEMNNKSVHQPPLVEEPVKDDGTALLAIMEDGTTPCNNIRDDVNVSSDVNLTMISLNAYISFILIHLFKKILVTEPEDVVSFCMNTLGSPKFQMLISEFFMKQQDKYNVGSKVLDCNTVLPEMNLVILIIGIQNSGKTTLVSLIKGARRGENTKSIVNAISTRPTMGVIPINMSYGKQVKIKFLDVGGHVQFRGVWENYYHSVHSIIFVIDASSPEETFQEAVSVSKQSFGHRFIQGKPILVFCNKMDIHGRRSPEDISSHMNLNVRVDGNVRVVATSFNPSSSSHHDDADNTCNSNIGAAAGSNNTSSCQMINSSHTYTKYPSSMVEHSIEWLLKKTLSNYQEINDRVLEDTQIVNSQRIKKRQMKEHRMLVSSICKAFGLHGEKVTDVLKNDQGEEFLAHEMGLEGYCALPKEGIELCSLLGYQKTALLVVASKLKRERNVAGNMINWTQTLEYIVGIRLELGLDEAK